MEADRFPVLAHLVTSAASTRRAALAAMIGGSLGIRVRAEAEAGDARERRKKRLKRQRRICKDAAKILARVGAEQCTLHDQAVNPAAIPSCSVAHNACLPYVGACKTSAGQACFAAFNAVR